MPCRRATKRRWLHQQRKRFNSRLTHALSRRPTTFCDTPPVAASCRLRMISPPATMAAMERIGKAAMLVVVGYTYLWTGLRAAVTTVLSSGIGWARLLAKRVHTRWKPEIPACMVSFRAALGPGMIAIAWLRGRSILLAACVALALLSDIFDGILARRWQVDSERLRRWDTRADVFFYFCMLIVVLLLFPEAIYRRWLLLAAVITAEVIQQVFAAVKYGRHSSYHSILAKIWGLLLAASAIALLGFGV